MTTWPQYFIAFWLFIGFAASLYDDGKKQSVVGLFTSLVIFPAQFYALYCGGFWSAWGMVP